MNSIHRALLALTALTPALSASSVVVSTHGSGGAIPDAPFQQESNSWNIVPYWPELVSTVNVPNRIDHVTSVVIDGLHHNWRGDLHVYLENPAGKRFNVIVRPGFTIAGFGDQGKCLEGEYTIVGSGGASLAQGSAHISGGTYDQYLNSGSGQWTTPAYPIANAGLAAIKGDAGTWKLHVRDWFPSATGAITGWRLFGQNDGEVSSFCFGDTSSCPCAPGEIGNGCANSSGDGATLIAHGSNHVSDNDLELVCSGMMPASASIFRQSTGVLSNGFGVLSSAVDGLACLSSPTIRVDRRGTIGSTASITDLVSSGAIPANGGARYYQVTYRDIASYCTGAVWNTSNAVQVIWRP
jgi:subtilisin-like proprotein convertase family protein